MTFNQSGENFRALLTAGKKVGKGKTTDEAGIDNDWLRVYATIARRVRDDRDLGITRYPYEAGPGVGPFPGGFFDHVE